MNLSRLKKASDYEVKDWLVKELKLTNDQQRIISDKELIRWAPFDFYKDKQKESVSFLWRFTMVLIPIYIIMVWLYNPLQFIVSGKWGINQTFLKTFHYPWMGKLKLNL